MQADLPDARVDVLPGLRRVGPADDLPLAGLVSEPVADPPRCSAGGAGSDSFEGRGLAIGPGYRWVMIARALPIRHTRASMRAPRPRSFAVLVIDDEQSVRDTAADLLQADGHMALVASTGEDGLAMVRVVLPDLVLVDCHMPVMDGLEVVQRLKGDAETRHIPLIAVTSGPADKADELMQAGCIAFIPKPFERVSFLRLVVGILGTGPRSSYARP